MRGAVSIQDFCFAREVKLGTYRNTGGGGGPAPPPGALVSARRMLADARAEPQYGERVPYVVVTGAPGARLADRCVAPEDLLGGGPASHLRLDAEYYIAKNLIPPLERIFNLVGANVRQWYDEMPRVRRVRRVGPDQYHHGGGGGGGGGGGDTSTTTTAAAALSTTTTTRTTTITRRKKAATLESYMRAATCVVCDARLKTHPQNQHHHQHQHHQQQQQPPPRNQTEEEEKEEEVSPLCASCGADAPASLLRLQARLAAEERGLLDVLAVCRSCAGGLSPLDVTVSTAADVAAAAAAAGGPAAMAMAMAETAVPCDSRDCPVFYTRMKQGARLRAEAAVAGPAVRRLLREVEEAEAAAWARGALEW